MKNFSYKLGFHWQHSVWRNNNHWAGYSLFNDPISTENLQYEWNRRRVNVHWFCWI